MGNSQEEQYVYDAWTVRLAGSVWTRRLHTVEVALPSPRFGALRTQKLKSHLLRTQSSKVLPLKPGTGPYTDTRATPTVPGISSLLIFTLLVHSPALSPQNVSRVFFCVGCG